MLSLFELPDTNEGLKKEIPSMLDIFNQEIAKAEAIFEIEGEKLEKIARLLPKHQMHYAKLAQESKAILRWVEIMKQEKESKFLKNYNNSPRALGVKEQAIYISGEKEIVELNQLLAEIGFKYNCFEQIVEALKQMGWMVGNITKLRVASLEESLV